MTIIIHLCKKLQCCVPLCAKQIGQRQRWCFGLVWSVDMLCFYSFRLLCFVVKSVEGAPSTCLSPLLKSSGVFIKIHVMCGYKLPKTRQQSFLWSVLRDSLYQNPGKTKRLAYTAQAPGAIYSVRTVPKTEHRSECTITWNRKAWNLCLTHESATTTS